MSEQKHTEPKYVAETLAWCNARRKERGKEPLKRLPRGRRDDPRTCPCGKATGLFVRYETYDDDKFLRAFSVSLPRAVQRFTRAFDAGRLPQYEAKP